MSSFAIDLLPKEQKKVADRLLYFILHYFRYIIVITQIVVISVFFYRFREDQKIIDLKESFKQKQQILAITLPIIEEAEAVELKSSKVGVLLSTQEVIINDLDFVLGLVPQSVVLTSIDISGNTIQLIGESESILSIRSFHKKLQQTPRYANVQIVSIQQASEASFNFGLVISVVEEVVAPPPDQLVTPAAQ